MSRQSRAAIAGVSGLLVGLAVVAVAVAVLRGGGREAAPAAAAPDTVEVVETAAVETVPAAATASIEVGGSPSALAVGEGSVWVVRDGRRLVRIDEETGEVLARIGAGDELGSDRPCGVAVGAGAAWVVTASGQVARISPATSRLARLVAVEDAACVAAARGGIWVTGPDLGRVVRLDPATGEELAEIGVEGAPLGIDVGFGSIWVATGMAADGAGGGVVRIDPRSNEVVRTIPVAAAPEFLSIGAGAVWVASSDGTIARIDPRTNQVVATIRIAEAGRTSVAAGDGAVYAIALPEPGMTAQVVRIDPATDTLSGEVVTAGRGALGLAVGTTSLWVANYDDGTLTRYTPPGA